MEEGQWTFLDSLEPPAVEAIVEAMFLAADADGEVSADEQRELCRAIAAVTRGAIGPGKAEALMQLARQRFDREGRAARLDAIGDSVPPLRKRNVLVLAAQVTIVDNVITREEEKVLLDLGVAFGLGGEETLAVVRAVMGVDGSQTVGGGQET